MNQLMEFDQTSTGWDGGKTWLDFSDLDLISKVTLALCGEYLINIAYWHFFHWSWFLNSFYGHSLPSTDSRREVISKWQKFVHLILVNHFGGQSLPKKCMTCMISPNFLTLSYMWVEMTHTDIEYFEEKYEQLLQHIKSKNQTCEIHLCTSCPRGDTDLGDVNDDIHRLWRTCSEVH